MEEEIIMPLEILFDKIKKIENEFKRPGEKIVRTSIYRKANKAYIEFIIK